MKNSILKLVELLEAISQIDEHKRNEDQNQFLDLFESKGLNLEEGDLNDKITRIRLDPKEWKDIKISMMRLDDDWDENI